MKIINCEKSLCVKSINAISVKSSMTHIKRSLYNRISVVISLKVKTKCFFGFTMYINQISQTIAKHELTKLVFTNYSGTSE